jgi:predicted amidohydrolase YtcJ
MANNGYADLVIRGGNVITVDPLNPRAQAVAVKFGRILAVGRNDEMEPLIGRDTRVTDVAGKTVIPGLIDAHCHGMSAGRSALQIDCGPDAVSSIAETKKAIMERCKATPKGEWICGFSYDDTKLAEKRLLKRADIDEVAPEHPVFIRQVSGHIGMANSQALTKANLSKESPDPVGGKLGRDPATRELDGTVYETAQEMFTRGTDPIIPPLKPEQDREAIKLMCSRATSIGITSAAEAIVDPIMFRALQAALGGGELTMRIYMLFHVDYLDDLIGAGLRTGFGDDWLRLGAIKILGDGAIAGRTAYLSEPYVGTEDDYGIIATPPEKLDEELMTAHKAGFQIAVHANGDKYIGMTLDAYEKAIQAYPREDHRHRIEHCTVLNPELLSRIKRLGIVAVPFGSYIYYHGEKMGFYGEKRLSMMFAHRSLLDAGVPVGGSSDHTCAPWFPLAGIQSCVTRKSYTGEVLGPEQRISPEEALWVYTMGSAYASFEENTKGSIEEGKLADMVVLEEDLTNVEPEQIKDIPIMATMVGGRFVYNPMSLPG